LNVFNKIDEKLNINISKNKNSNKFTKIESKSSNSLSNTKIQSKKSNRSLVEAMNTTDPNKLPGAREPFTFYPPTVVGDVSSGNEDAPVAKANDVDGSSTATTLPMAGQGLIKEYK